MVRYKELLPQFTRVYLDRMRIHPWKRNLLYFMIKDHPYADGCKRIAASLFLEFLDKNNALFLDGEKRLSDGTLVAITLMIAESKPEEKEVMVKLVMNLLKL